MNMRDAIRLQVQAIQPEREAVELSSREEVLFDSIATTTQNGG